MLVYAEHAGNKSPESRPESFDLIPELNVRSHQLRHCATAKMDLLCGLDSNRSPAFLSCLAIDFEDRLHLVYSCVMHFGSQQAPWNVHVVNKAILISGMNS